MMAAEAELDMAEKADAPAEREAAKAKVRILKIIVAGG